MRKTTSKRKSIIVLFAMLACALLSMQSYVSGEAETRHISSQFRVRLFDESVIAYKDIQGKIAVIDFWGTWCKPCLAEIPDYNAFYRDYRGKGILFIGLAGESGNAEKVKSRSRRLNISYPVGAPSREELRAIGKIKAYPTTWIVAPSGEIIKEFVGIVPGKQDAIRKIVDRILTENSSLRDEENRRSNAFGF